MPHCDIMVAFVVLMCFQSVLVHIHLEAVVIPAGAADSEYSGTDPASEYPAVIPYDALNRPSKVPGECAGTVVHKRYVVTAAHCFSDVQGDRAKGGTKVTIGNQEYTSAATLFDPCWNFANDGPNSHDLALLKFDTDLPVTPVGMYTASDEQGQQITLVGWGDTGTSSSSMDDINPCCETSQGCVFRVAHNQITNAGDGLLTYTFDNPSSGGLPLEGLAYTGDSGGPAFIDGKIAGVNSGGDCCGFGSQDQFVRLSDKVAWLNEAMQIGSAPAISNCAMFPVVVPGNSAITSTSTSTSTASGSGNGSDTASHAAVSSITGPMVGFVLHLLIRLIL